MPRPPAKTSKPLSGGAPVMMFAEPLTGWWAWFAWYPVRTWDARWRWLCLVERRRLHTKPYLDGPYSQWFQHRVIT